MILNLYMRSFRAKPF